MIVSLNIKYYTKIALSKQGLFNKKEEINMVKSKLVEANKKIENVVVGEYQKIEDAVVKEYQKVEDKFVDHFLRKDGETIEETKNRLNKEKKKIKTAVKVNIILYKKFKIKMYNYFI